MSVRTLTRTVANKATNNAPLIAGLYLRISDDREGRAAGVERQLTDTTEVANRMSATIYHVYTDNDIGASTRTKDVKSKPRKQYLQLLADAKAGRINIIIAYTSGRLTRRPQEFEGQIELAETRGTRYAYVKSPDFDLNTAQGRMMARIMANFDTGEAETISERVTRAAMQRAVDGGFNGGVRPFGFGVMSARTQHGIEVPFLDCTRVREDEAEEIRKATRTILAGGTLVSIVRDMTARGVSTVSGKRWLPTTLRDILIRPRNASISVYRGEEIGPAPWDAIIDEDDFRKVVQILNDQKRRTSPGNTPRWLGSLIYRCVCGSPMTVRRHDGGEALYRCTTPGGGGHVARNATELDTFVTALVLERLARPDLIEAIREPVVEGVDLPALRIEQDTLRDRLNEMAVMFAEGSVTPGQMITATSLIEAKLAEVDNRLSAAVAVSPLSPMLGVSDVEGTWSALSLEARRGILRELLDVMVLPPRRKGNQRFDPAAIRITWVGQTDEREMAA